MLFIHLILELDCHRLPLAVVDTTRNETLEGGHLFHRVFGFAKRDGEMNLDFIDNNGKK